MKPFLLPVTGLLPFLLVLALTARPQAPASFDEFAQKQDKAMMDAYYKKDTTEFLRQLAVFRARYDTLSNKKNYAGYLYGAYYNLGCTYSLVHDTPKALEWLRRSIAAGYSDYTHIQHDADWTDLRNDKRFIALIAPLRETGDYAYILHKGARYNPNDNRSLPSFRYQPSSDTLLVALRRELHLDSIAGKGTDVSQVLQLLHWLHDLIPHDGSHNNPPILNASSLIAVCREQHRGLNCRGLAIILNDCYQAMGFASRYVTCLPKDSLGTDPDCHVINSVFIPSLKKWIWIDPTNNAYVMDEKGNLLSIEEVRQRLINQQPLLLNPDANWNHRSTVTKEDYLYTYMSKNLYMLQCPVDSRFDYETRDNGKEYAYIELMPLDYFKQGPDKEAVDYNNGKGRYVNYHTNNPNAFWALP